MRAKEPEELWEADLDDLENVIKELAEAEDEEAAAAKLQRDKLKSKRKAKRKKTTKKKKIKEKISSTVDLTDGASLPASPARSEMTDVISVLSPESDVVMSLADRLKARMLSSQESDPSALAAIAEETPLKKKKRLQRAQRRRGGSKRVGICEEANKDAKEKRKVPKRSVSKRTVDDDDDDDYDDDEFVFDATSDVDASPSPPKKQGRDRGEHEVVSSQNTLLMMRRMTTKWRLKRKRCCTLIKRENFANLNKSNK